jgi:quinone-modifying oxidoreductase subunit QmoB
LTYFASTAASSTASTCAKAWSGPIRAEFPALTEEEKEDEDNFDRVQMMAEDYIKMGMIRVEKDHLPEPYKVENLSKKILVMGGGITGMSAAIDAAKAGYDVTIVEKTPVGRLCSQIDSKHCPVSAPYDALIPPVVTAKLQAVEQMPNITVKTETKWPASPASPASLRSPSKNPARRSPSMFPFRCPTR